MDKRKAKIAMLYLASKQNFSIDMYKLINLINLADELHEAKWGDTISEREYQELDNFSLINRLESGDRCKIDPRDFINDDCRRELTLEMITQELSESEMEALDLAYGYLWPGSDSDDN